MEVVIEKLLMSETPRAGRSCGECTACCTVLSVAEIRKPMRWACEYVQCGGCRIYDKRPPACRDFNCLWLRGAIAGDESHRPDKLGVMFDFFFSTATNQVRFIAFELWNGAFDGLDAAALLAELSAAREVQLSYRNGTWRTIGAKSTANPATEASWEGIISDRSKSEIPIPASEI
jgi:hypothetical protein